MTLLRTYAPDRRSEYGFNGVPELFNRFFNDEEVASKQYFAIPPANILESGENYRIELAVPGFQKSDFSIELDENLLVISLDKQENHDDKEDYVTREFAFNKFKRSFRLSDKLNKEDISAKYKNGILTVYIPKKEEWNRSIEVS